MTNTVPEKVFDVVLTAVSCCVALPIATAAYGVTWAAIRLIAKPTVERPK